MQVVPAVESAGLPGLLLFRYVEQAAAAFAEDWAIQQELVDGLRRQGLKAAAAAASFDRCQGILAHRLGEPQVLGFEAFRKLIFGRLKLLGNTGKLGFEILQLAVDPL